MKPVDWGILSTARIALDRVIPAMQAGGHCRVQAIASRALGRAQAAAARLGIPKAYGSYDELLRDPAIEAVYIGLPNHLHLEWASKALEAGKHVLCEKPITMDAAEARQLIAVRDRTGLVIEEAFMVRNHPQWAEVRELVDTGAIGAVRAVQAAYCHTAIDPADIRNQPAAGGGALYDIGCYAITIARLVFGSEPLRACALIDRDPTFGVDRWASAILAFPEGHASFFVSIQSARYQHVQILGSRGWLRADLPFAHGSPRSCRLFVGDDQGVGAVHTRMIEFDPVDQYTLQGDRFARLVRGEAVPAWPLETAVANMAVIDALFRSAASGGWADV